MRLRDPFHRSVSLLLWSAFGISASLSAGLGYAATTCGVPAWGATLLAVGMTGFVSGLAWWTDHCS